MSALGQKRTSAHVRVIAGVGASKVIHVPVPMSAFGGKADTPWNGEQTSRQIAANIAKLVAGRGHDGIRDTHSGGDGGHRFIDLAA
jgi:hypothetical protein